MKCKGKSNTLEYIIEMSNLTSKLKSLKLDFGEELLVHLVLISLSEQFEQLICYFYKKSRHKKK